MVINGLLISVVNVFYMLAISIKDAMPSAVSCSLSEIVIPESASFTPATSAFDACLLAEPFNYI